MSSQVKTYTEIKVQKDGSCIMETSFNDDLSEIHGSQITSVDGVEESEINTHPETAGIAINIVDESKVPKDLNIEISGRGDVIVMGDNADRYSIDQETGHLIFTEL